jgi:hypothetical protein
MAAWIVGPILVLMVLGFFIGMLVSGGWSPLLWRFAIAGETKGAAISTMTNPEE